MKRNMPNLLSIISMWHVRFAFRLLGARNANLWWQPTVTRDGVWLQLPEVVRQRCPWLEISCQHGRVEQPSVWTSAWWQEARGCPTCGTGAVRLIPLDNSSPNQSYLGPVRLRYHEIWDQPASCSLLSLTPTRSGSM
jgi:hypothetical protein